MLSWPTPHGLLLLSPLQHHTAHIIQPSQFSFLLNRSPILFKAVIWSVKPIYPVLRWSWDHHSHSSNERDSVEISTWGFWEKHAGPWLTSLPWPDWRGVLDGASWSCEAHMWESKSHTSRDRLKPGASGSADHLWAACLPCFPGIVNHCWT